MRPVGNGPSDLGGALREGSDGLLRCLVPDLRLEKLAHVVCVSEKVAEAGKGSAVDGLQAVGDGLLRPAGVSRLARHGQEAVGERQSHPALLIICQGLEIEILYIVGRLWNIEK